MNILAFFQLVKRCDELERRLRKLEAYVKAEGEFRQRAWVTLADERQPLVERHTSALRILAGYTSEVQQGLVIGDYLVTAGDQPVVAVMAEHDGTAHVIYGRSASTV